MGVDITLEAPQEDLRRKSVCLCETFITLVQQMCSRYEHHLTTSPFIPCAACSMDLPAKNGFAGQPYLRGNEAASCPSWGSLTYWVDVCRWGFKLVSPEDAAQRGSHICLSHPEGYAIVQVGAA